jgi:hypothetical protein
MDGFELVKRGVLCFRSSASNSGSATNARSTPTVGRDETDDQSRFLEMERHWLVLARSYELTVLLRQTRTGDRALTNRCEPAKDRLMGNAA